MTVPPESRERGGAPIRRPRVVRWTVVLVALTALAAHHQILLNGFILVDDPSYVTANPQVRSGLTAGGVAWAFTAFHAYNWHPLTWLSHMADVALWGLEPAGHHFTSWVLHAANAALLLLVLRRATGSLWRSTAVALLFAAHPVHVESVAWAAERKDTLSTFLLFCTLFAYVGPGGRPSRRGYLLALGAFALGLMAKPMLVMTPALLLAMDVWPLRRVEVGGRELVRPWSQVVSKAPFLALALASVVITLLAQNQSGKGALLYESPWYLNAGNALLGYVRYLGLLAWPVDLAFVYPFRSEAITVASVGAALLALLAITATAVVLRRSRPFLLFGWVWYVIALLPVAGFLRFGYQAIADRYLYVPAVGLYVAAVWGVTEVLERARVRPAARVAGAAVAIAALVSLSVRQELRWRSSVPLLERAIALYPDNPLPHRVLGSAYAELGRLDRAIEHRRIGRLLEAQDTVELNPGSAEAHHRLGEALASSGRDEQAIAEFVRALELDGSRARTYNSLGVALAKRGRVGEATAAFESATRLGDPDGRNNLALMRAQGEAAGTSPAPGGGGAR